MSLSGLPDDVLKIIMQHVPLRDRLTSCCLVNRRLHAAAVAAIDVMMLRGDHTINKAFTWLASYGHHLTKLHLVAFKAPLLQLPCPNLQELNLDHCCVELGPTADGQRGVLEACTKLTRLELGCDIMDQPLRGSMLSTCLDRLQHLQHLHVLPERNSMPWDHYAIQGLPISTLPRLQHLTYLVFENLQLDNLLQLGSLTRLQRLSFGLDDADLVFGPGTVPGLVVPGSLTSFSVQTPAEGGVLSMLPTGLRGLALMCVVQGPAEGPDLLLLGVAGLQQLRSLNLIGSDEFFWPAAGPAYNALTASSGLVSLVLMGRFPEGILPHVFPAQCRLPHLTYLRFGNGLDFQGAVPQPVWNAADLSRLVSCCPNLRSFIDVSLQHGRHVSVLTKLQDLRTLHVQYGDDGAVDGAGQDIGGATFAESVRGLATLTQLRRLHYYDSEVLVEENFLPLTSLTTLTALQIIGCNLAEHAFCKRQDGTGHPVWLQLLQACAKQSLLPVLQDLAQQLSDQKSLIAQLQQQLTDQTAAQQQVAEDQSALIAALQAQLQLEEHAGAHHSHVG